MNKRTERTTRGPWVSMVLVLSVGLAWNVVSCGGTSSSGTDASGGAGGERAVDATIADAVSRDAARSDAAGNDAAAPDDAAASDAALADGPPSPSPMLVAATVIGDPGSTNPTQNQSARNALWSRDGDLVVSGLGGLGAPTTAGVLQPNYAGHSGSLGGDCWVGRLSADLSTLTAATLFGGSSEERPCYGLAEKPNGHIVIAGVTQSQSGIATSGAFQPAFPAGGTNSGFVAVLSSDLKTQIAGTYVGAPGNATLRGGVRVLSTGSILAFGQVDGNGLGTAGVLQNTSNGGGNEAWLGALSGDLSNLAWGT